MTKHGIKDQLWQQKYQVNYLSLLSLIPLMEAFPTSYHRKWYVAKTRSLGLHFCRRKFGYLFMRPRKLPISLK